MVRIRTKVQANTGCRMVTASRHACLSFHNMSKSVTRNLLILLYLIGYKSSLKNSRKQLTVQTDNYFAGMTRDLRKETME